MDVQHLSSQSTLTQYQLDRGLGGCDPQPRGNQVMSTLHSCPHCSSLNPHTVTICLNCDEELTATSTLAPQRSSIVKNVIKGAALVTLSMTLSACYGGGEEMYDCYDADGDGACETRDCDDNDPTVVSCAAGEISQETAGETSQETAGETLGEP